MAPAVLRKEFASLPGIHVVIGQPISHRIDHMLSGTRANIAIKIFGADLYELRRLGEQVKVVAEQVLGAVDVSVEAQIEIPFVNIRFMRDALACQFARGTRRIEGVWRGESRSDDLRGKGFAIVMAGNLYTESGDCRMPTSPRNWRTRQCAAAPV